MSYNMHILGEKITSSRNIHELDAIISSLNLALQRSDPGSDESDSIRRLRQKAYDRKKKISQRGSDNLIEMAPDLSIMETQHPKQKAPWILPLAALIVALLLLNQTLPLYHSSRFGNPLLAALGSLIIMIGFAAYHATAKTIFSLLLCSYACAYEIAFVVSGSAQDESLTLKTSQMEDPTLKLLQANMLRLEEEYRRMRTRYTSESSDMHQNQWFRKNHLDTAYEAYAKASAEFDNARKQITEAFDLSKLLHSFNLILKIAYRLGLVLLLMVLIHHWAIRLCCIAR